MNQNEIEEMFSETKAIITGHFVYRSGKHGLFYMNKDAIYLYPEKISSLCLEIASHFIDDNINIVIAPAIGGVILSQWVAYHLTRLLGREILAIYAEKDGDVFIIKRGYDKLLAGKNVLVVEDIVTTGESVNKVIEKVLLHKGKIIGLGILCNRGNVSFDVPKFLSLLTVNLDAWDKEVCPLCAKGIPINTQFGKGKQFLACQQ